MKSKSKQNSIKIMEQSKQNLKAHAFSLGNQSQNYPSMENINGKNITLIKFIVSMHQIIRKLKWVETKT